jgi:hypothetical protein
MTKLATIFALLTAALPGGIYMVYKFAPYLNAMSAYTRDLAPAVATAPEIDPSSAVAALTLLAGAIAILVSRRR